MRNQAKRAALFAKQRQQCALCRRKNTTMTGWAYKPDQNVLICKQCNTTLGNYLRGLTDGITPDKMDAFLARVPEPAPKQTIQLTSGQYEGLRTLLGGQTDLSLTEWCMRVGITEEDAIQYARQHGIAI